MYLIKDRTDDAQRLPLLMLIQRILDIACDGRNAVWHLKKARGYGVDVCSLEDDIVSGRMVLRDSFELMRLARDPGQWFYELDCFSDKEDVRFGVLDSWALFIDGGNVLIESVLCGFEDVSEV